METPYEIISDLEKCLNEEMAKNKRLQSKINELKKKNAKLIQLNTTVRNRLNSIIYIIKTKK